MSKTESDKPNDDVNYLGIIGAGAVGIGAGLLVASAESLPLFKDQIASLPQIIEAVKYGLILAGAGLAVGVGGIIGLVRYNRRNH